MLRSIAWTDVAIVEALSGLGEDVRAQALLERVAAEMERLGEPGGVEACAQSALSGR